MNVAIKKALKRCSSVKVINNVATIEGKQLKEILEVISEVGSNEEAARKLKISKQAVLDALFYTQCLIDEYYQMIDKELIHKLPCGCVLEDKVNG